MPRVEHGVTRMHGYTASPASLNCGPDDNR